MVLGDVAICVNIASFDFCVFLLDHIYPRVFENKTTRVDHEILKNECIQVTCLSDLREPFSLLG